MAKSFEEFVEYCAMHPRAVIYVSEDLSDWIAPMRALLGLVNDLKVSSYLEAGTIIGVERFFDEQALPQTWLPRTIDRWPMPDLWPG